MAPSLRVTGARRLLAVVTDTGAAGWGGDRPGVTAGSPLPGV